MRAQQLFISKGVRVFYTSPIALTKTKNNNTTNAKSFYKREVMITDFSIWYLFGSLAVISGILNGVFSYMITFYLSKHSIKINYWNIRLYMLKYLKQYRNLTIEENGKAGNLFYAWMISISLFLISAVILIVQII